MRWELKEEEGSRPSDQDLGGWSKMDSAKDDRESQASATMPLTKGSTWASLYDPSWTNSGAAAEPPFAVEAVRRQASVRR
ncbi:hypothetical protein EJB05_27703, partial [Eragrostis curvula]